LGSLRNPAGASSLATELPLLTVVETGVTVP
jgi:hypothetical protein